MPSDKNNDTAEKKETSQIVEFPSKKNDPDRKEKRKASSKGKKKTLGWAFGVAILILLAIIMVLPNSFARASSGYKVVFGSYDGKDIAYEVSPSGSGNHFATQVQTLLSQNPAAASDYNQLYQLWNSAYQNEVFFVAANAQAKKAGLDKVASMETVVADYIRESGYYNNAAGAFDAAIYNNATALQKSTIKKNIQEQLPSQIIINDLYTVQPSSAEKAYISDISSQVRAFDYVSFPVSAFPDALAIEYAQQNPAVFSEVGISRITVADQSAADSLLTQITAGTLSFEKAAEENSVDAYASVGGVAGTFRGYELKQFISDDATIASIMAATDGGIIGPFPVNNGYGIVRIDSVAKAADTTDAAVLSLIKDRISVTDTARMDTELQALAQDFMGKAATAEDFENVAGQLGMTINAVHGTPFNPAGSQLAIFSFSTTDSAGFLAAAAADEAVHKELFAKTDTLVRGPYKSGTSYVVVRVGEDSVDEDIKNYLDSFYDSPYMTQQLVAQDAIGTVLASDKHTDGFMSAFFSQVMGLGSN